MWPPTPREFRRHLWIVPEGVPAAVARVAVVVPGGGGRGGGRQHDERRRARRGPPAGGGGSRCGGVEEGIWIETRKSYLATDPKQDGKPIKWNFDEEMVLGYINMLA